MSEKLLENKHFVNLLITAHPSQTKALLTTASLAQVQCLVEIAYNLIETQESLHHRQKRLLEYLSNLSVSLKRKKPLLVKHRVLFVELLKKFRSIFESIE